MKKMSITLAFAAIALLAASAGCAEEKPGDAYFKGVELASQGNIADAKAEFTKSLADYTIYAYAKLELKAIDEIEKGKIRKETALLVFQGKQLATKKKWDEAIALYNKAIKENPNYAYAFVSRGIAYMSQGNFDKAISNYSEAISVDPQFTEAYQNRGVLYEYRGQFNKAIKDFDVAISADPSSYVLYFNRGMAFVYKGQYEKALPDLNKAIEIKPDFAKAYINKGLVCEELKMAQDAVEAYKMAVKYDDSESKEIAKDAQESIKAIEDDSKKNK